MGRNIEDKITITMCMGCKKAQIPTEREIPLEKVYALLKEESVRLSSGFPHEHCMIRQYPKYAKYLKSRGEI